MLKKRQGRFICRGAYGRNGFIVLHTEAVHLEPSPGDIPLRLGAGWWGPVSGATAGGASAGGGKRR